MVVGVSYRREKLVNKRNNPTNLKPIIINEFKRANIASFTVYNEMKHLALRERATRYLEYSEREIEREKLASLIFMCIWYAHE